MGNSSDGSPVFGALEVGEFYLNLGRMVLAARGIPSDMNNVATGVGMSGANLVDGSVVKVARDLDGLVLDVQHVLVERSLEIERELSEGRNVFRTPASHRLVLTPREGGHIDSTYGTVIENGDGPVYVIDFDSPEIVDYFSGYVEGTAGDCIRVRSQLVGLLCDEVRFSGLDVGVLRDAVGLLGDAVSAYRDNETSGATNKASGTETN